MILNFAPLAISPAGKEYFQIHVIDDSTGRGVPLVKLETVNKLRFYTDSNGNVAFLEPGLMERRVFFFLSSDGYEFPKDGFGYPGEAILVHAGGRATVKLKRINVAERLCRLTGQGIYRDTRLLGLPSPLDSPVMNGGVLGQDTAQAELYRGKMLWFWGDTDRAEYPLGNFHTTGAEAYFPKGVAGPGQGLEFHYLQNREGFVKPMVPSSESLPIWVSGLTVLGKGPSQELYAYYARMKSLGDIKESGYLRWDDQKHEFGYLKAFAAENGWRFLDGHIIRTTDHGVDYALGNFPPSVRVRASLENLLDPKSYEAFTCQNADGTVARDSQANPFYRWQTELAPATPAQEERLVAEGRLKQEEAHFLPLDNGGQRIFPHGGSVHWNEYRKKWIAIFTRKGGKGSELGEIYYCESESPTGPFKRAVKILSHHQYTFYNPVQHPFLDQDKGRIVYLEGTYTAEFSGNPNPTPLYNYNQILYRLDLADPRLKFAETN